MIRKISARHGIGGNFSDLTQLPDKKLHPPVEFMTVLNASPLVKRRIAYARSARARQNMAKSDKITFSNSNFLPLKKLKKQAFR